MCRMTLKQAMMLLMALFGATLVWQLGTMKSVALLKCAGQPLNVNVTGLLIRLKISDWCLAVPDQPTVDMAVMPQLCGGAGQEWIMGVRTISPKVNPSLCMEHHTDDDDEDPPSLQLCNSTFAGWTWSRSGALMSLGSMRCLGINQNLLGQELIMSVFECASLNAAGLLPAGVDAGPPSLPPSHPPFLPTSLPPSLLPASLTSFRWSSKYELAAWLEEAEQKFGGLVRGVPCKRGLVLNKNFTCKGGDRMTNNTKTLGKYTQKGHNYGLCYASYFDRMLARWQSAGGSFLVAEIGILQGSGLAIWSELFPSATVYGFDFDLVPCQSNMAYLKSKGAFRNSSLLHLHRINQLDDPNVISAMLHEILQGRRLSLVIDDGLHSDESIVKTFKSFREHLHPDGLYLVEDNHCGAGPAGYGDPKQCKKKLGQLLGSEASGYELSTCAEAPRFWAVMAAKL